MKIVKHPLRFQSGADGNYTTGVEYRIPFGGIYYKYDDGGKVFKFFAKDGKVRYGAQRSRGLWYVKVEIFIDPKTCNSVEFRGVSENFHEAFKQLRTEIDEYKRAVPMLPNLKP